MAIAFGLLAFFCALLSPAFVQTANADVQEYGTVIGIVSRADPDLHTCPDLAPGRQPELQLTLAHRISEPPTVVWVL